MIVIMPAEKFLKKKKKIFVLKDFVIVNCTTNPKVRDLPNVLAEIRTDEDGLRTDNITSLAYQMDSVIFDETVPVRRKEAALNAFFLGSSFQIATMNILATQMQFIDKNIYVLIEDKTYNTYIDRYIEEISALVGDESIVYTWNSVEKMKTFLEVYLEKNIKKFDKDQWFKNQGYNEFDDPFIESLEDDEYDIYLDNVSALNDLRAAETNKEIRYLFFKHAKYAKKQLKIISNAITDLSSNERKKREE
jgi:hypothetical protein